MKAVFFGGPRHGESRELPASCWEMRFPVLSNSPSITSQDDECPTPSMHEAIYQRMKGIDMLGQDIDDRDASLLAAIARGAVPFVYRRVG